MSCEHGNPHAACDLCDALAEAYKRGYSDAALEADRLAALAPVTAVDDATVDRAESAAADYWQDEAHVSKCESCNGSGVDRSGQDWCGECGGTGEHHAGTETGALRAALTAALKQDPQP